MPFEEKSAADGLPALPNLRQVLCVCVCIIINLLGEVNFHCHSEHISSTPIQYIIQRIVPCEKNVYIHIQ